MNKLGNKMFRNWFTIHIRQSSRFSTISGDQRSNPTPLRSYQVIVAATRKMGIGNKGKLPWNLPSDLKFFKNITATTSDQTKRNAVIMGRNTWESLQLHFRPLPGRLNVILSRSLRGHHIDSNPDDVITFQNIESALTSLASPPFSHSIEKVFVIGGGHLLRETLNASKCDAIHITEIETCVDCDTFIPAIDRSLFRPWYLSEPILENGVRFRLATYVRNDSKSCKLLPRAIVERHEEYSYLKLLREIISSRQHVINPGFSKSNCKMEFHLRKSFPLLTSKTVPWNQVVEELFMCTCGSSKDKLSDVIEEIKNLQHNDPIVLSLQDPSDLTLEFCVANGEISCQASQASADMILSVPLTIALCALLTRLIAHLCDLATGDLTYKIGKACVNITSINTARDLLLQLPKPFPTMKINPSKKDINALVAEDFQLVDYESSS